MLHPKIWSRPLIIPEWAGPSTLLNQQEAAELLGVDRRTVQRAERRGEGPPHVDGYVGPGRWYRVQDLLLWRFRVTGRPLTTAKEIEDLLVKHSSPRPNPPRRAPWWRVGERRYYAKRRMLAEIKQRLACLDLAIGLADGTSTLAQEGFEDALRGIRDQ